VTRTTGGRRFRLFAVEGRTVTAALWLLAALALTTSLFSQQPRAVPTGLAAREDAYRQNNIGVSRLEQFDFEAAASAFRQALAIDSSLALARFNLGVALFYGGNPDAAKSEIETARASLADRPEPDYLLGLIARATGDNTGAFDAFMRVQQRDPSDVGTLVNLAQLQSQAGRTAEAIALFRRATAAEPFNATAQYGLATALIRAGQNTEGNALMARFERLRETSYAVTFSQTYLEQGRYAEAIASTGAERELVDPAVPGVAFVSAATLPSAAGRPAPGGVALVDLDSDGDLDLAVAGAGGLRLFRNDTGRFVDAREMLPAAAAARPATAVAAGDFNNDGRPDLAVLRPAGLALLEGTQTGALQDVTVAAGLAAVGGPAATAAWVDSDHDGDLDLMIAGPSAAASSTHLFRNNGNGRFTDVTTAARVGTPRAVSALVPTDYDDRRDIDLLAVAQRSTSLLFRNLRDGTFRDVAAETGLRVSGAAMAAAGDVNKDGYPDFFFARPSGAGLLALSDGRGRFTMRDAPPAAANARAALWIDYDDDGLLDLIALTAGGPRLLRGTGREWTDVTARAFPASMVSALTGADALAAGDLDGDGHTDLVAHGTAGVTVWRSDGSRSRTLRVTLTARASNRTAAGAKIDMRAGSLRSRIETYAAAPAPGPSDIRFGVGERAGADVIRVLWPSGILQAETGMPAGTPLSGSVAIEELDRKPSSCPFLFAWNGTRFDFITDFLGGGEMGYLEEPGRHNTPDSDEYVRIAGDRLVPRGGQYELRVTNELEEVLFLDRVQLLAVAHPAGVEIHPNEGLRERPSPFELYTAGALQAPLAARDETGRDVLDRVRDADRRFVDMPLAAVRGYAADHSLVLTLPAAGPRGRRRLLLTGWTDYAFSTDNIAGAQGHLPLTLPSLDFRDQAGRWRRAIDDIGIPVGRPQTVVVDLTGRVPASAREVRIRTSMRIYWDQVQVDASARDAAYSIARLDPRTAVLRWRGFSAEVSADGREPWGYDYARVSARSPWKLMPGRYTREGDVVPLLDRVDDMFVITRPGDEIALAFDAGALPPLPQGWTRTFLLYADGFSKEMDLHSASPDVVLPLPFHRMTRYPYTAPERYPLTAAHRTYLDRYNTRVVGRTLPAIESVLDAR
jgi:tetratricopeptide (TPR) repeat protein